MLHFHAMLHFRGGHKAQCFANLDAEIDVQGAGHWHLTLVYIKASSFDFEDSGPRRMELI
jgi:hypothetical protein